MTRVLVMSAVLHVAIALAVSQLRAPSATAKSVVEVTFTKATPAPPPPVPTPPPSPAPTRVTIRPHASAKPPSSQSQSPSPSQSQSPSPSESPSPSPQKIDLFSPTAITNAAGIDLNLKRAAPAPDHSWRPRHGVGGEGATGGIDVASFLAEDAARFRVSKGAASPELRRLERHLNDAFSPTFAQADVSNRAELLWKQFRGFLKNPPKTGELARTMDPTKETNADKLATMRPDRAFFLGRRVEIFVRQKADGTIVEIAVRQGSGYRAYDDAAMAAVERALGGKLPAGAENRGEVRTLWQLDATAYVILSPTPLLVFDEAGGKSEWLYPLQKRVDHEAHLIAVY